MRSSQGVLPKSGGIDFVVHASVAILLMVSMLLCSLGTIVGRKPQKHDRSNRSVGEGNGC